MIPYLVCSILSPLISAIACQMRENIKLNRIFSILSILPFCLLAAMRSYEVGVDTAGYPLYVFSASQSLSLSEMFSLYLSDIEPLFLVTSWVTARIFNDFGVNLFVFQLLTCGPILYVLRKTAPRFVPLGLFVYSLIFFPFSLNIVRQSISAAFLLVAWYFAYKHQVDRYALAVVLSVGFHLTGIVVIIYWPIVSMLSKYKRANNNKGVPKSIVSLGFFILAAFVLLVTFSDVFLDFLTTIKSSYSYQQRYADGGSSSNTVLCLGIIAFVSYYFAGLSNDQKEAFGSRGGYQLALLVAGGVLLSQASIISPELLRCGFGVLFATVPYYSKLLESAASKSSKFVIAGSITIFSILYFLYVYVIGGAGEVVPYFFNPDFI